MTSQTPPNRLNRASNEVLDLTSFLNGANAAFIEQLYAQYQQNPDAVDDSWRAFFADLGETGLSPTQLGRGPGWRRDGKLKLENGEIVSALTGQLQPSTKKGGATEDDLRAASKESVRAIQLVRAYRVIGHLEADLDPLKITPREPHPQLEPSFYGFHE
ncbi:MAG TPA: hypothetical protein VGM36_01560, partial [Rhizomicrobium sp.]